MESIHMSMNIPSRNIRMITCPTSITGMGMRVRRTVINEIRLPDEAQPLIQIRLSVWCDALAPLSMP
jgi:hypothetical protein